MTKNSFELNNLRETEKKKYLELEAEIKTPLERIKFFSVRQQTVSKEIENEQKALGYLK